MKVDATIGVMKVDGNDKCMGDPESTTIMRSVWNNESYLVEITLGGHWYTLRIAELRAALDACQCAANFYVPRG